MLWLWAEFVLYVASALKSKIGCTIKVVKFMNREVHPVPSDQVRVVLSQLFSIVFEPRFSKQGPFCLLNRDLLNQGSGVRKNI